MIPIPQKKIYVFGNPLLNFDNLPLKITSRLKKTFPAINFIIADPNENLKLTNGELTIIDTVEGINKVTLIRDLDKLKVGKTYSLHDFDLAFNLKLFQKIGRLKKIKIIGIPMKMKEEIALKQVSKILKDFAREK